MRLIFRADLTPACNQDEEGVIESTFQIGCLIVTIAVCMVLFFVWISRIMDALSN
jgi:hypothetical protein